MKDSTTLNNSILEKMTEEYQSVYSVNPKDGSYEIVKASPVLLKYFAEEKNFRKGLAEYIGKFVHEDDRKKLRELTSPGYIGSMLAKEGGTFRAEFRDIFSGKTDWHLMEVTRLHGNEDDNDNVQLLFGFSNKTDEILLRHTSEKIFGEFTVLYMVNLEDGELRFAKEYGEIKTTDKFMTYDEVIKGQMAQVTIPETRDFMERIASLDNIRDILRDRDKYEHIYQWNFEDGSVKWLKMSIYSIEKSAGETSAVAIGISEVDEAVRKEMELQKKIEQEVQVIRGLASDCVSLYTADLDHNTYKVYSITNEVDDIKTVVEGYSNLPKALRDYADGYVHEEDREKIYYYADLDNMRKSLENCRSQKVTVRRNIDGKWVWIEMNMIKVNPVSDPATNVILAFTNRTKQVLEEKAKQEELERALTFTNFIMDSFISAYYINIHTHQQTTYVRTNELHDKYDSIPDYLESVRKYIAEDVHPDDRERMLETVQPDYIRSRLKEEPYFSVMLRDISSGTEKNYRCTIIRGADENHIAMAFADVSEEVKKEAETREQLENALVLAQAANKAKSTFLNNMSHDIRTPMNSIVGYTGLAASHIDDKEQVQAYLGKIMNSSNHLLSLINDVLDMARIESGKMNLTETKESLPEILHTLHDIVLSDVNAKQLDFYIDTVNIKDETIICDKTRLNQVLLNILSNAIKYTPAGGTVTLRIAETAVSHSGYGTYEFHIKDSGIGMNEEELSHIYMPFERAASADDNQIVGTGLGMSIVKNIVDMMGGQIDIKSREGQGTEVTITLEFKLEDVQNEPGVIPALKGARGIVVDDDMNACKSISMMLRAIGMRTDWCTSGKECVFRTEEAVQMGENYKVYIIDWLMPDMNGIETARRIRRLVGDDVPIVILTAYDYSDIEEEAKEAGVTAFISKPIFQSDLSKTLRELCIKEEVVEKVEEKKYDFTGKKILIVEDNEDNLDIAEQILTAEGIKVSSAANGKLAVEIMSDAEPGEFDLILMDIRMPVMNGLEAAKKIRALTNGVQDIPILALTANAFAEDKVLALEAGMNEHITKPLDVQKLKGTLAKYL